ncbi:cobalt transport protein, cbiq putative [Heliomicrobium modesticaldum Ice1]|uniref:Energy-coupling factor transporter transmembrane protein EcfT n=1 Tax=Heliobacterium modesticaldum (strain ATCC 51547 / Ice1) TaxID=498761 RepID=ECFT_HELMI|nr:energy-coupling factor transporter transmembrane component T [Heliomicrobium modesticaldum]B0TC89.1 RecName: Full=Energy-coupling factor transporter transmembrane protein EcfT; Short=ECF transporter T component EcfT [Heliomicrobium modesticaldum Ice1]ABZ83988.1 cobalt transport protein, cbiq putative [Heliomicrobium modesticaldum Ice1]
MLKDITLGQYVPLDSPVHRLDPRTKVIATLLFSIALFLLPTLRSVTLAGLPIIIAIVATRLPIHYILRGIKPLWIFIVFTLLVHLLSTPGETAVRLGPFAITWEGLRQGAMVSQRLIWLYAATSLLTLTTSPIALTDGLELLLSPGKRIGLPVHEFAMMTSIALRFIPTLIEETEKIMKAQSSRGADFDSGSLVARVKSLVPLMVPLLLSAFRRADELAMAMEARCYRGGEGRTRMRPLVMSGKDYAVTVAVSGVFILICLWKKAL